MGTFVSNNYDAGGPTTGRNNLKSQVVRAKGVWWVELS